MSTAVDGPEGDPFVSTGELPQRDVVKRLVREAHDRYRARVGGDVSQAYPAIDLAAGRMMNVSVRVDRIVGRDV